MNLTMLLAKYSITRNITVEKIENMKAALSAANDALITERKKYDKTSLGVVAIPTTLVGGYVYCPDARKWVLYVGEASK